MSKVFLFLWSIVILIYCNKNIGVVVVDASTAFHPPFHGVHNCRRGLYPTKEWAWEGDRSNNNKNGTPFSFDTSSSSSSSSSSLYYYNNKQHEQYNNNNNNHHQKHYSNKDRSTVDQWNNVPDTTTMVVEQVSPLFAQGILVLMTVPLAWGTYSPVVKFVYTMDPPVPGLLFSAAYYVVAASVLLLWQTLRQPIQEVAASSSSSSSLSSQQQQHVSLQQESIRPTNMLPVSSSISSPQLERTDYAIEKVEEWKENIHTSVSTIPIPPTNGSLSRTISLPWRGGIELGSYLFVANVLQVIGLQTVPANRAGFLIQLTTILVPLIQVLLLPISATTTTTSVSSNSRISPRTWLACCVALLGVIVIDLEDDTTVHNFFNLQGGGSNNNVSVLNDHLVDVMQNGISHQIQLFSSGDMYILLAALVYSLHVVRLQRYATDTTALELATGKACVEVFWSVGSILALILYCQSTPTTNNDSSTFVAQLGHEIVYFVTTVQTKFIAGSIPTSVLLSVSGAILWTGIVTCAYTIFAQSYGQRRVHSPTQANLIYTLQPFCTAFFAFVLLGEIMPPTTILGGFLIVIAVVMVSTTTNTQQQQQQQQEVINP